MVLATFGRLALIAPLANLAIVPVVPVAMAAGGVAFVAGALAELGAPDVLTAVLAFPGWLALTIMVAIAHDGNRSRAAAALKIERTSLLRLIRELGIVDLPDGQRGRPPAMKNVP